MHFLRVFVAFLAYFFGPAFLHTFWACFLARFLGLLFGVLFGPALWGVFGPAFLHGFFLECSIYWDMACGCGLGAWLGGVACFSRQSTKVCGHFFSGCVCKSLP